MKIGYNGNIGIPTITNSKFTIDGTLSLKEQAAAVADTAAYGQIWVKNDDPNTLWFTNDAGQDYSLKINAINLLTACTTNAGTLDFSQASKTLTVENNAIVSQDYSADGTVQFAQVTTSGKVLAQGGIRIKLSNNDVSEPPTDAELDAAFGAPQFLGNGFVAMLDDNNAGTNCYLVWTTGTSDEWFYAKGIKAV